MENIYSEIKLTKIERTRVARYVIISPAPEENVITYMDNWAKNSGLLDLQDFTPRKWGWNFPYVTNEQTEQFGLRGYVYCYTIPNDFNPKCGGAEITFIEEDKYATIRITDPFKNPFETIPTGWQQLIQFTEQDEYKIETFENRIAFEEVIEENGVQYMDLYIPVK